MRSDQLFNKYAKWMLGRIATERLLQPDPDAITINKGNLFGSEIVDEIAAPSLDHQHKLLHKLKELGLYDMEEYSSPVYDPNFSYFNKNTWRTQRAYYYRLIIHEVKFNAYYKKYYLEKPPVKSIKIQTIRLENQTLIINDGRADISFNAKNINKRTDGSEELKTFKIFELLWEGHYEVNNRKTTNKKKVLMISDKNLMLVGKVPTKSALDRLINRLNTRFANKGLNIKIKAVGDKYKLTVNFE